MARRDDPKSMADLASRVDVPKPLVYPFAAFLWLFYVFVAVPAQLIALIVRGIRRVFP